MSDVHEGLRGVGTTIVGRELELAVLHDLLASDRSRQDIVISGEPGIGKTTLWEAAIAVAREQRLRVLTAWPSDSEAQLSFAGLIDLLDGVDTQVLAGLPAPQLRAIEVALLRAEPTGEPQEPRAIAVGFLSALRALASREPLLIAIDDIQWLDPSSADTLAFAARRLEGHAVSFLLARRAGGLSVLEQVVDARGAARLEIGPLSLGATRRVLHERLGLSLPRRELLRVFRSARGNPLLALELGRALAGRGLPQIGDDIPVTDMVEDLLGTRVQQLPAPLRRLLLASALSGNLRVSQLAAIAETALDDAIDAGLLLVAGDHVRAAHPLLAAAARKHCRAGERRALHLELAGVAADEDLRARHLALATEHPDEELARTVAAAAAGASARGAAEDAAELAEHALRLTPPASAGRAERVLALAEYLLVAGKMQRATDLLTSEGDSLPRGAARVHAHLLLADGGDVETMDEHAAQLERAFAACDGDPVLRAPVLARMVEHTAVGCVERIAEAEAWALEALPAARLAGSEIERPMLYSLGWARILRGRPVDDLNERFRASSESAAHIYRSLDRLSGIRLAWRGNVSEARATFTRFLSLADERGEAMSYIAARLQLCELELRAGEWAAASHVLDERDQSPDDLLALGSSYERCRALLAAGRGFPDEAEGWAADAIAGAEASGVRWDFLEALRARGIAALLASEPARAVESLRAVWNWTQREGIDDPGAFPVAPDLIEALLEIGEVDEALAVTDRLRELAERQDHPWGMATTLRCAALVRLRSRMYDEQAALLLRQAAAAYAELGLRFDRARSLLSLGRAERRLRKWGAARLSLEQAAAAFDEIGSVGWAERARSELARVGGRRPPTTGQLTPAERGVVELAAAGLSNKQIAATLFVGENTVEVHLSHAYAKLGVRSRAQLAAHLAANE